MLFVVMAAMARAGLDGACRASAESTSCRVIKPSGLDGTTRLRFRPDSRARDFAAGVAGTRVEPFATAAGELTGVAMRDGSAVGGEGTLCGSDPAVTASPVAAFS